MKNEIPVVITEKDCLYISDILNISKVYIKKTSNYLNKTKDKDLQNELSDFKDTLLSGYDELLFFMEEKK
jgi:hypothetical protein